MAIKMDVIILAAGLSKRMGTKNKLLLDFQKSTILESTISNILKSTFQKVIVVLGHEGEKLGRIIERSFPNIEMAYNSNYQSGQVSSVKTGLKVLDSDFPFMVALGDMPFIDSKEYQILTSVFFDNNIKRPSILRPFSSDGRVGNPVVFDQSFKADLLANEDLETSKSILQKNKGVLVKWETNVPSYFKDLDTFSDYKDMIRKI